MAITFLHTITILELEIAERVLFDLFNGSYICRKKKRLEIILHSNSLY